MKAFEALVGSTWEGEGDSATGNDVHIRSTYEWIPSLEAVYARAIATNRNGELVHELDAYFYRPIRTDVVRCLALSNAGGVYEGELTVLDGGALQLDLKGYEGDRVVAHVVRFDFEEDGTLRHRDWSLEGTQRTLLLDVSNRRLERKRG